MVSDNLSRNTKSSDSLIEYEERCSLPIRLNCGHGLDPLGKVVDDHDNMLMPSSQSWVAINEVWPILGEGTDDNDWMKRGWMQTLFSSEHLVGVTLFNCFNAIFKDHRPEKTGSQYFLGCCKPR